MRLSGAVAVVASIVTLTLALAAAAATAKPLHPCGGFHAMGELYGVQGKRVGCGFQRRWARSYVRHGLIPRGWGCRGRLFDVGACYALRGPGLFQFYKQD